MDQTKTYQITSFLQESRILVLMEQGQDFGEEHEIKFGDFTEDDVSHTVDDELKSYLDVIEGEPSANLARFHTTLVKVEGSEIKMVSTEAASGAFSCECCK